MSIRAWARALRVHQWSKNVLLFLPIFALHDFHDLSVVTRTMLGFVAFSLAASAVYIVNDARDVEDDRLHPTKRRRPFATGELSVGSGALAAVLLITVAAALAISVGSAFAKWLLTYVVLTTAYTYGLKRLVLLDAITLAMLYTIRVFAGGAASGISLSFWLVTSSIFLFLSLAFLKRYAELVSGRPVDHDGIDVEPAQLAGRGYRRGDASLVQLLGVAAGFSATLVLALYVNSTRSQVAYQEPGILWASIPVAAYWISWMWLKAHRGEMHDDPVIFALRDRASWASAVAFVLVLTIATIGLTP